MGIPKQVMEADETAERELEALDAAAKAGAKLTMAPNEGAKTPTHAERPATVTAKETPKAETAPAEARTEQPKAGAGILAKAAEPDDIAQIRADAHKWHTERGRINKLNEEWGARVSVLQKEVETLKAQLERREREPMRDADGNLSDESRKQLRSFLGEDYSDAELENFARAARFVVGNPTQEVNAILAERDRRAAEVREAQERDGFIERLRREHPGFVEMDASDDPRLVKFYQTALDGVMCNRTYGDVAKEALAEKDYPTFDRVVRAFAKAENIVFSPNANQADDAVAQARPAARPSSRQGKQPRRVPRSEINAFRKKAFANRAEDYYGMTSQQVEEQLRFYEESEENDRVDEEL